MSARHSDTIYKLATDGSVVWRLGGVQSDFVADFEFMGQHDARIQAHNKTHTLLSMYDNASRVGMGNLNYTGSYSRGVLISLEIDTTPMKATLLREYPHPDGPGSYNDARGNMQLLPNSNVLLNWVKGLHFSEHSADGDLVLEVRVKQGSVL